MEKLFIKSHTNFLFKLALAYGMGAALITLELFSIFFILKLKVNLTVFYLFLMAESALLLYLIFKNKLNFRLPELKFNLPKIKISSIIIFILILIQIVLLSFNALARPPIAYDNLTMWQYKPKVLFYEKQINFNEQQSTYLGGGGHINYPWLSPMLSYWLYANLGEFNDSAGNLINISYYLAILIIIYNFLKKYLSAAVSLIFVWLFSTMPLPFYHAYNGYADLILSFYLLLAFIFLFYWLETQAKKQLLIAGIFFSCALFTKNDALMFTLAGFLIILIKLFIVNKKFMAGLKNSALYLLAIILPMLPWLFIKIKYHLAFSNVDPGIAYHGEVWQNIYWALFLNNSFNIWWFVVIISLAVNIIKIKKQNNLILAWLFLIFCFCGLTMLYLFTEEYRFAIDNTALSRNFLALIPISVALAAVSFRQIKPTSDFATID
jgi:4-amino-4-deoxy-L-arabinose transferase-like glycosyltransferase